MNASAGIRVSALTHSFRRGEEILSDLSLDVAAGELVALIGPSGCGKSTVLNAVAGLVAPTSGEVAVDCGAERIAYVFQSPRLLPWRDVLGNVTFGLEQRVRRLGTRQLERARAALATVHLEGQERRYPHELSGGMQQRVALARGLAIDPAVLLLDEPFSALDALTRGYLQEELLQIVGNTGATALLVTHDIDEALLLADRIVVMSARPGRIRTEIQVPFPRGRSLDALVLEPAYPALRTQLRELLRPDTAEGATA